MTRRTAWMIAAFTFVFLLESTASAQVIILPRDATKDKEEFSSKLVNDWVLIYLGRKPTEKEHALLMQRLRTGTNPITVQSSILSSDEYFKKNGSNTQGFINGLFKDILGRKATPAEILQLSAKANGAGRARFAADFLAAAQGPIANPVTPTVIIIP